MKDDQYYMEMALKLGEKGKGYTSPNPAVGCVIVKNGTVVGTGWHKKAGTPHAEVWALQEAGPLAKGATLYVTLEPCSHYGKTPPCANAIINAGISRVVAAMMDPNPLVSGQGLARLKEAGIEVSCGLLEEKARLLNEDFLTAISQHRPFLTLKVAATLDGKTAAPSGESQWITGETARAYGHYLRSTHDGILTGITSILTDDSQLTCRIKRDGTNPKQPIRIVLDSKGKIPLTAKLLHTDGGSVYIIGTPSFDEEKKKALTALGATVLIVKANEDGQVSLQEAIETLYTKGLHSILIEGGATVHSSFIKERLFDKIEWFIGNAILGSTQSHAAIGETGIYYLKDKIPLFYEPPTLKGDDIHITAYARDWRKTDVHGNH